MKLTSSLEELGAFKDISKYGTKIPWEQNLKRLNVKVQKHKIVQLFEKETKEEDQSIVRHRTAMSKRPIYPF